MRIQDMLAGSGAPRTLAAQLTAATARASRGLEGLLAPPPPQAAPLGDVLLADEVYGWIDGAVARIGLVVQCAEAADDDGRTTRYHRLPTRHGPAALIQIPGKVLAANDRAQDVALIGGMLTERVDAVFVLTDARQVNETFRFHLWPSWKRRYFREVAGYDGQFLDFLKGQSVEERLETLSVNFSLDPGPPAKVELRPGDAERVIDILLGQALGAADPEPFLRQLVDRLYVGNQAKARVVGLLRGDLNQAARALVQWACAESYPEDHEMRRYTVAGALLGAVHAGCGVEERLELAEIVERYGLIRDREVVAGLRAPGGDN